MDPLLAALVALIVGAIAAFSAGKFTRTSNYFSLACAGVASVGLIMFLFFIADVGLIGSFVLWAGAVAGIALGWMLA